MMDMSNLGGYSAGLVPNMDARATGLIGYSLAVVVFATIIVSYFWFYRQYGVGFCVGSLWSAVVLQLGALHKFGEFID